MGLPEYFAMCRHWKRLPPLAVVAAAYFPLERREEPVRDAGEPETDIAELFAMVGQSFNG